MLSPTLPAQGFGCRRLKLFNSTVVKPAPLTERSTPRPVSAPVLANPGSEFSNPLAYDKLPRYLMQEKWLTCL